MYTVTLSISGLRICFRSPMSLALDEPFKVFVDSSGVKDLVIELAEDENEPDCSFCFDGSDGRLVFHPSIRSHFTTMRGCLIHLPMEKILLKYQRFILHSSFVTSPYGALLFSGASGIGKSTQAALWCEHRGSSLINGDRSILTCEKGEWFAWGSPYAGSSNCFKQVRKPVGAIVLLEQSLENRITAVSSGEACRSILLQTSQEIWTSGEIQQLCDLIELLVSRIPVYRLSCTPDLGAVEVLEQELMKGSHG